MCTVANPKLRLLHEPDEIIKQVIQSSDDKPIILTAVIGEPGAVHEFLSTSSGRRKFRINQKEKEARFMLSNKHNTSRSPRPNRSRAEIGLIALVYTGSVVLLPTVLYL